MIIINIEKTKEVDNEHYFIASATSSSNTKKHYAHQKSIVKDIVKKFNIKNYDFISSKSSGDLTKYSASGVYVLKVKDNKLDNKIENVKIDEIKTEAKTPQIKEQKKEASLPNGLKKIEKTKAKKATKKKIKEE
tara:strand:+ start:4895 stop:5296 length:402 start_codon:yes stop_codon:yes gene_type:complete